ncbi:MAG: sulfur carrier protein ThiS [Alphaproteobacteria bacterium]|nr:sulfur carrier protein ThiS [Alphaproteobacteria bacterium]
MKISVNGKMHNVAAHNVAHVLEELRFDGTMVATAVNGEFVPAVSRAEQCLAEGDRLEVLRPMQGG